MINKSFYFYQGKMTCFFDDTLTNRIQYLVVYYLILYNQYLNQL